MRLLKTGLDHNLSYRNPLDLMAPASHTIKLHTVSRYAHVRTIIPGGIYSLVCMYDNYTFSFLSSGERIRHGTGSWGTEEEK